MALSNSYNFSISEDKSEENHTNNANFKFLKIIKIIDILITKKDI